MSVPNLVVLDGFLPQFKIGTTVKLKSGSPDMTVTAINSHWAEVQWFEGDNPKQKIFPMAALTRSRKSDG
jgi:uncharacterized protein YodC (DUF2158 family)